MGWELELTAIPSSCTLLDCVKRGEIDPDLLSFVPVYLQQRRNIGHRIDSFSEGCSQRERFVDAVEELIMASPQIEWRSCCLGKRFDWLEWLLVQSAAAKDTQLIASTAIAGEQTLVPPATSTQGFPIRCTSAPTCELIHIWLEDITEPELRAQYDPTRMAEHGLYKWFLPDDPEATFEQIHDDFVAVKRLYRDVTKHSEALLIVTD